MKNKKLEQVQIAPEQTKPAVLITMTTAGGWRVKWKGRLVNLAAIFDRKSGLYK